MCGFLLRKTVGLRVAALHLIKREQLPCESARLQLPVSCSSPRLQRTDLRRVQVLAPGHAGGAHQCHAASRNPGDDQQVYDGPHPNLGEAVSMPCCCNGTDQTAWAVLGCKA